MPYAKRLINRPSVTLALTLAGLLLLVPVSISANGTDNAFASDGDGSGQQDHHGNNGGSNSTNDTTNSTDANNGNSTGNNQGNAGGADGSNDNKNSDNSSNNNSTDHHENNKNNENQTESTSGNDTSNGHQQEQQQSGRGHEEKNGGSDDSTNENVTGHGHSAYERMQNYVNETAEVRHQEHLSMDAPITGPFTANLNYTLSARGNATEISNSSTLDNASLTLNLSIWKSTKSVVSMDIVNGTVKIGGNQIKIYSGHAYYLLNKSRLLVFGFVVDNNGSNGEASNSSSISEGHSVKLLKLFISGNNSDSFPVNSSDPGLPITVLSPESKLASEWFLDMNGQVQRS